MHYLAALLVVLVAAVGGAIFFTDLPIAVEKLGLIEQEERRVGGEREPALPRSSTTPAAAERAPANGLAGPFDIAKVDPNGTSVFAGRSVPNSVVTVMADGAAIGSANTDENGEWVLVTEQRIPNPNPKLSVQLGSIEPRAPAPRALASAGVALPTAEAVSAHLMDALRLRVERARADAEQSTKISEPTPGVDDTRDVVAERQVSDELVATAGENLTVTTSADVLPVPIKFIFREAAFTDDGAKAAQLLLDYLLLKKPPSISMTGHADERGTPEFNLKLSADRLGTVSEFLRAGGYAGRVEIFPKGDTAPFQGVDRTLMPRDQLYELDRRVELQISE
jgi:outer membrane protein OmpA-like peptidoglycan-associated protein